MAPMSIDILANIFLKFRGDKKEHPFSYHFYNGLGISKCGSSISVKTLDQMHLYQKDKINSIDKNLSTEHQETKRGRTVWTTVSTSILHRKGCINKVHKIMKNLQLFEVR